ncbi:MAG: hypothetical protein OEV41_12735 [Gammaproteobacteria bacterium]|nr:hypothetical protein [Gammaproteobacteria bacterium]
MSGTTGRTTAILAILQALCCSFRAEAAAPAHRYTVSVDGSLQWLQVEARFGHAVDSVTARSRGASRFLGEVQGCERETSIRMRNRRMMLPDGGIRCLRYTVDLDRAGSENRNARYLSPQNAIVSPSYWLWRPELFDDTTIEIEFSLPDGMSVSVPWRQLDDAGRRFQVGRSPESAYAPVVFGDFDFRELEVPGATLRVALIDTRAAIDNDAVMDWVQATANDVSLAYGYFPNPSPQVVVIPVDAGRSASPVPFGRVVRDGGETVELYVDPSRPQRARLDDWTATHEFSHMMLPYLHREHHWISEGFAQYYQNILMARAGAHDEEAAWAKIHAGLERGRDSRPELSPNQAATGSVRSARMKVYWSGAALALMADVTLRERSGGKESLDTVLQRLQACCLPSPDTWTGPGLFQKLDSLIAEPVFTLLYRRYADTAGFPDTSEYFERLGIRFDEDRVTLRRHAELADIRSAMTRTDMPNARWRDRLATVD